MNSFIGILKLRTTGLLICVAGLIGLTGCLDDKDPVPNEPIAYVSLYHGSPDAPGLDIEVDNNQINSTAFDYADYSGYLRFYPGDRNLKFGPFSSSSVNIDSTVTFEANKAYSVFVADEFENAELVILDDNSDAVAAGKVKIRIINLSPDAGNIDFRVEGETDTWASDLEFKDATEFMEVDAGEFDLQVNASDDDELLLSLPDIRFQSQYFYTIVIRGYDTTPDGNTNVLAAQVVVN